MKAERIMSEHKQNILITEEELDIAARTLLSIIQIKRPEYWTPERDIEFRELTKIAFVTAINTFGTACFPYGEGTNYKRK